MIRRFLPIATASALALALTGCGPKPVKTDPPPSVVVATPLSEKIVDWDDYVGHFEAVDAVDIRPRVSGYLSATPFKDGDFVKKGAVLFEIDPRPYQAAVDAAKAQLTRAKAVAANAQAEKARAEALFAAKAISEQDEISRLASAQTATADTNAAEAALATAELNLSFTKVRASISGRISARRVSPGNLVSADQSVLTTLVSLNPIRFVFNGAEDVYLKYQREDRTGARKSSRVVANPVAVRLQDERDYRWKGHMDFVDNAIDPTSGTIKGRAVIANPDNFLTPGLFGHLRLLGSGAYDALVVPDQAVVTDQSRQAVYVVGADNVVSQRLVETGPLYEGLRVIRTGLTPTDRVVIDGVQRAKAGRKVAPVAGKIAPSPPPSGPPATPPTAPKSASGAGGL